MQKKLYRSNTDKKIAGVCGGIAQYFNTDSTVIRLALVVFCLLGGAGLLLYIIAALVMPEDPGYTPYSQGNGFNQGNDFNQNNGFNQHNGPYSDNGGKQ